MQDHVPAFFSVAVEREGRNEYVIGIYLSGTGEMCPFVNLRKHGQLERYIIKADTNNNMSIILMH